MLKYKKAFKGGIRHIMDLKSIKNFVAIAENGSISKAARELHISQPPLTKQMQNLEEELNATLFERTTKGVQLTGKGKILYRRALSLIAFSESISNELNSTSGNTINMSIISSSSAFSIMLIEKYLLQNEANFSISEGVTFNLLESLERHMTDLIIIRTPFDMDKDFEYVQLTDDELVVVGKPELFSSSSGTVSFDELYQLPLMSARRWISHIEKHIPETHGKLHFKFMCDDTRTALSFASRGMCISLVPKSTIDSSFSNESLVMKQIAHNFTKTSLFLVYDKKHICSDASRKFIDFIKSTMKTKDNNK